MANYADVPQSDFPLTVVVTDDSDREVHRTTVDDRTSANDWDGLVSPDLEERFPGEKKLKVLDANGKTVHEKTVGKK